MPRIRDTPSAWLTRSGRSRTKSSCLPTSTWSEPITALDFTPSISRPPPIARADTINQWVEKQTNDKIQNLLGPGTVTPLTRLILTNAIYFKAAWADQFNKDGTENEDFHLSAGKTIQAPTMHNWGGYEYFKGPDLPGAAAAL